MQKKQIESKPLDIKLASYVKIRVEGLAADIEIVNALLAAFLDVSESSKLYKNTDGQRCRQYVTIAPAKADK